MPEPSTIETSYGLLSILKTYQWLLQIEFELTDSNHFKEMIMSEQTRAVVKDAYDIYRNDIESILISWPTTFRGITGRLRGPFSDDGRAKLRSIDSLNTYRRPGCRAV